MNGSIRSEVLGLDLNVDSRTGMQHLLRFRDPKTGEDLLTFRELEQALQAAERELQAATRARQAAEAENARLNARVEALGVCQARGDRDTNR